MSALRKVIVLAFLGLTGCAPSAKELAQKAELDRQSRQDRLAAAEVAACSQKYPKYGENYEFAVPYAQCILNGYNKYHNKPDDLYYSLASKRLALSHDLYNGRISFPDFQSEMSNFAVQIYNIRLQREYAQQIARQNQLALKYMKCQQATQDANDVYYRNSLNPPTTRAGNTLATLATVTSSMNAASACN
jgi:hypothetical protein